MSTLPPFETTLNKAGVLFGDLFFPALTDSFVVHVLDLECTIAGCLPKSECLTQVREVRIAGKHSRKFRIQTKVVLP